jgi:hypothetical protein
MKKREQKKTKMQQYVHWSKDQENSCKKKNRKNYLRQKFKL